VARKYIKKFSKKLPQVSFPTKVDRDGHRYFICKLPFGLSEEGLKYWLARAEYYYLFYMEGWDKKGGRWKKRHGEESGRRQKYLDRDRLICEIYKKCKQNRTQRIFIYDIINGELRKRKYLESGEDLSDERLRKIISKYT